ncbi:MAG: hypothetical protein Q7U74_10465, partial [Saprospiraceae bacterium]|nr:hypothetical protein [Saprospiraceae bacterium]
MNHIGAFGSFSGQLLLKNIIYFKKINLLICNIFIKKLVATAAKTPVGGPGQRDSMFIGPSSELEVIVAPEQLIS